MGVVSADTGTVVVRLQLGGPWMAVPLDADDPRATARHEVDAFLERHPELQSLGSRFVDELVTCVEECRPRGVLAAAFYSEVAADGGLLEGWLEVRQADREGPADDHLAESLARLTAEDTRPREVDERTVAAGTAVRVRCSRDVQAEVGRTGYVVEYLEVWFPDPAGERAAVIAAMTPSVARSDHFIDAVDRLVDGVGLEW